MGCCGPKVVAGISCVIDILCAIIAFLGYTLEKPDQSIVTGVYCLILAFACLLVIFAGDNASLFRPFLVLKPVILIVLLMLCIVNVSILLNEPFLRDRLHLTNMDSIKQYTLSEVRSAFVVILVVCLLLTALFAWFYSIIFRAYVKLAEKSASDNANLDAAGPTCCCGPCRARIETAIPVFALIGFFFLLDEARGTLFYKCLNYCSVNNTFGYLCLVSSIAYLVVIFAQNERNPSLFLPYLFIMPVILIIRLLNIALMLSIIIAGSSLRGFYLELPPSIGLLSGYVIFTVLHIWFYSLIFRAYNRTKQQMFSHFIANSSSRRSRVGP
ncbi:hypothetical protein niasHT_024518 [Heterodera trifolii]|uniref:Transmembrane protein n=1 Tax=Heterodera trifolii TaxID=157864 RepID=A0ABD2K7L3_9BILA